MKRMQRDEVIKFQTGDFRIAVVRCSDATRTAMARWGWDASTAGLWGQAAVASTLYSSFLKGEERVVAEVFDTDNKMKLITEVISIGEIRGCVKVCGPDDVGQGKDALVVSKVLFNQASPYTSRVSAVGGVQAKWQAFYDQSEQVPTYLVLQAQVDEDGSVFCGGVLIQALPPPSPDVATDPEEAALAIAEMQRRAASLDLRDIFATKGMRQYVSELTAQPLDSLKQLSCVPLDFLCRCSKQDFLDMLRMLPRQELEQMVQERTEQRLTCHFCNQRYAVTTADLETAEAVGTPKAEH